MTDKRDLLLKCAVNLLEAERELREERNQPQPYILGLKSAIASLRKENEELKNHVSELNGKIHVLQVQLKQPRKFSDEEIKIFQWAATGALPGSSINVKPLWDMLAEACGGVVGHV